MKVGFAEVAEPLPMSEVDLRTGAVVRGEHDGEVGESNANNTCVKTGIRFSKCFSSLCDRGWTIGVLIDFERKVDAKSCLASTPLGSLEVVVSSWLAGDHDGDGGGEITTTVLYGWDAEAVLWSWVGLRASEFERVERGSDSVNAGTAPGSATSGGWVEGCDGTGEASTSAAIP